MKSKCRGLSLVELLIAVAIGLFLTAVIANIYLGTKQTYRTQEDLSRLQEEGRYALELLQRSLRLAGYRSNVNVSFTDNTLGFPATAPALGGTEGGANPDTLSVRYFGSGAAGAPDNTIRSCTGAAVDGVTRQTDTFSLVGGALDCNGTHLIDHINDLQVQYGIDSGGDHVPDQYVDATLVADWNQVVSVKLCIEMQSANDNVTTQAQTYTDCSGAMQTAGDRRYRRTFATTVALRNRLP